MAIFESASMDRTVKTSVYRYTRTRPSSVPLAMRRSMASSWRHRKVSRIAFSQCHSEYEEDFKWPKYLKDTKSKVAPDDLFYDTPTDEIKEMFKVSFIMRSHSF